MEVKQIFSKTFEDLRKNPKLIWPPLLKLLLIPILIIAFLLTIGLYGQLNEINKLNKEFYEQQKISNTSSLLNLFVRNNEEVANYAQEKGFNPEMILNFIKNPVNWIYAGAFILIYILAALFLDTILYSLILSIKRKGLNVLRTTNHFILRLLVLKIIYILILMVLIIIAVIFSLIIFLLIKINIFLGLLFVLILALLFLAIIISLEIFLTLSGPIMFVDDKSPLNSIISSFKIAKSHFKKVAVIFLVVFALYFFVSLIERSLSGIEGDIIFFSANFASIFSIILFPILLAGTAFATAFAELFLFNSYLNLKNEIK